MRQAIVTRYLGPTNHRSARIKAKAAAGSVTVNWDHAMDPADNHFHAACALLDKMGWNMDGRMFLAVGGMPDDTGNVYVLVERRAGQ